MLSCFKSTLLSLTGTYVHIDDLTILTFLQYVTHNVFMARSRQQASQSAKRKGPKHQSFCTMPLC